MDKVLEIIGLIGLCAVGLIMMVLIANSGGGNATMYIMMGMVPWAVPAIIGCLVLIAFGSMLGQLKAIRRLAEAQLDAMTSGKVVI